MTPVGTSNELDVQNGWEENTHTHTRLQYDINVQQEREKRRQAVVFVSSFHPRGGVFCCSWWGGAFCFVFRGGTGRGFFFPRRDGAVVFFSEAGRGVFFFFPRRDGTGRCFFVCFEGRDGTVVFGGGNFLAGRGKIVTPSRQPSM